MEQKLLTREDIIKMADNRMDLSKFSPEYLKALNEAINGDYAAGQEEQYAYMVRGIDMFMTIGSPVEISYEGKTRKSTVTAFGYEHETEFFKLKFRDGTYFRFRTPGFAIFGATGAYYGIVNDPDKKSGIRFLNFTKDKQAPFH